MSKFLIQVKMEGSYPEIIYSHSYTNLPWASKPRDKAHGEVKAGDELLAYCTGSVPDYRQSLAFSVKVASVSAGNVTFYLEEPHWFRSPLNLSSIHSIIAGGELSGIFGNCGTHGFSIAKLGHGEAQQALELLER